MALLPLSCFSTALPYLGSPINVLLVSATGGVPGLASSLSEVDCVLHEARTLEEAARIIERLEPAAVVTEETVPGGDWRLILNVAKMLVEPPEVIVASRNTWLLAEVTMEGGMDVLLKPYTVPFAVEMILVACQRWFRGQEPQPVRGSGIARRAWALAS